MPSFPGKINTNLERLEERIPWCNTRSPQAQGLIAWYPPAPVGVGLDRSPLNRHNGTFQGNVLPTIKRHSEIGYVMDFAQHAGDNVRIDVPDRDSLDMGSGSIAFTFWFLTRDDSTAEEAGILDKDGGGRIAVTTEGWMVDYWGGTPNRRLLEYAEDDRATTASTTVDSIVADTLYHCIFVNRGGNWKWYIDGALNNSGSGLSTPTANAKDMNIGCRANDTNNIDGFLKDVRLYEPAPPDSVLLQSYWPQTRWDLWKPQKKVVGRVPVAGGLSIPIVYHHRRRMQVA